MKKRGADKLTQLAARICHVEGKKSEAHIGDVKEILSIMYKALTLGLAAMAAEDLNEEQ